MVTDTSTNKSPQWLALHFPHLALDQHEHAQDQESAETPLAISDKRRGRQCIYDHNQAAERAGVQVGMPVGAALSLVDTLQLFERDRRAERACLQRLASWCYQYSSQVCIAERRNTLLLEVAASRRLFGSAETLTRRIVAELEKLGYRTSCGIAPTPEAAHLAASHGLFIHTVTDIRKMIGKLGIDSLNLQPASKQALHKMGFRTAAEVFRLPRKALARRLGLAVGDYLDRLLGHRPDPCKSFRPPDSFSAGVDLVDTRQTQGLIFPLRRLVQELCGVLRAHDRGIQVLQVRIRLEDDTKTISLNLQQPTRSESHLMLLLRERLERLQLPCPATSIRLQASHFLPCKAVQTSLLEETHKPSTLTDNHIIERLQARLGAGAVKGVTGLQDYRPEYSWSLRELDEPATYSTQPGRPVWLLPEPRPCRIDDYQILTGPERIETGWWDGRDCRRDYFVVRDANGSTLWAFHEYKPSPGWYLHGLFS